MVKQCIKIFHFVWQCYNMQKYVQTSVNSQMMISLFFFGQWLMDNSPMYNQLFDRWAKKLIKNVGSEIILLFPKRKSWSKEENFRNHLHLALWRSKAN